MLFVPRFSRDAVRRPLRSLAFGLGVAAVGLLSAGCNEYPQSIFRPTTEFADTLDGLFKLILVLAMIVFVVVETILVVAAVKHRRKPGDRLPEQVHGSSRLEVAWTIAPAIVLGIILWPSTQAIFETQAPPPNLDQALKVTVVGHQFWWEFQYPDLGVVTANEVHMPQGQTVYWTEESADVIHSFWIPALGGKRDVVPGHQNHLWWTPRETGTFPGQCAELCGYSHANMRMRGMVDAPADFQAWVQAQKAPAVTPAAGSPEEKGAQLFQQRGCAGCHTISGTAAQATVGPNLTHVGSRTTIAAGIMDNTPDNLKKWIGNPTQVKPGSLMPNLGLSEEDLTAVAAYLTSLK